MPRARKAAPRPLKKTDLRLMAPVAPKPPPKPTRTMKQPHTVGVARGEITLLDVYRRVPANIKPEDITFRWSTYDGCGRINWEETVINPHYAEQKAQYAKAIEQHKVDLADYQSHKVEYNQQQAQARAKAM